MNPLKSLPCAPHGPGEAMPCALVWSSLSPQQRDQLQRVVLRVCCQLANAAPSADPNQARTPQTPSSTEVAHERA